MVLEPRQTNTGSVARAELEEGERDSEAGMKRDSKGGKKEDSVCAGVDDRNGALEW